MIKATQSCSALPMAAAHWAYGPFSNVWYKNILYKVNELDWIRKKALKNADRATFLQI
ncbi:MULTISPECIES: hypothetical protein [Paenibacillus]|uniref:Uncharacterized protein n=1 Tax=Paenibacillus peoriae TaxID=59893 RepID=A0A7H0Y7B2_9BACL|nr:MULTISPECIES: hypothetical protein [Paenibacillus]MCP3781494.1 hypothetical protein [Paenibacillus sp. MZ03-122A]QNR66970.1 hypothetical protein IAQ67_24925 [Paenibacillus peoriae]